MNDYEFYHHEEPLPYKPNRNWLKTIIWGVIVFSAVAFWLLMLLLAISSYE